MSTALSTPSMFSSTRNSALPRFLLGSATVHLALFVAGVTLNDWWSGPAVTLDTKPIRASLVRLGKPRDEKLLPRKEEPPPPPPPPAPPTSATPAPTTAPATPSVTSKTAPSADPRKSLLSALSKVAKPQELEGATDGDPHGDAAKEEGERYYALLNAAIRRNYDVSNTIPEAERRTLKTLVLLSIGPDGQLMKKSVAESSGNEVFDAAVLSSVQKAAPFAPPPPHLRDVARRGVQIVFTP